MPDRAILGRTDELAAIEAFLDAPDRAALVIGGEAGIGKTAILDAAAAAIDRRPGWRRSLARASASEAGLAFVTLTDLLEPILAATPVELPGPQQVALDAALLRGPAPGTLDPRTVGMAVLGVLRAAADPSPLAILIDDAQWVDAASSDALAFALRRLPVGAVKVIVAVRSEGPADAIRHPAVDPDARASRPTSPAPFIVALRDPGNVQDLPIGPVSLAVLHHLIVDRLGVTLTRPRLARVERASGGNPLLAIEIVRELVRLDRWPGADEPLPVPADTRRLIEARLGRLDASDREVLCALATMAEPDETRLEAVMASVDPAIDVASALRRTAEAGLTTSAPDGRPGFVHPLVAAVSVEAPSADRRRLIHARLADLATTAEDRGRHLAAAAIGPSRDVAEALDAAAIAARRQGAPSIAADWAERAAGLTPHDDLDGWAVRTTRAGRWFADAGEIARARALLTAVVERVPAGDTRAVAMLTLAQMAGWDDGGNAVITWCDRALAEAADPDLRARLLLRIAFELDAAGLERAREVADEAVRTLEADPDHIDPDLLACALLQRVELLLGAGIEIDRAGFERARSLLAAEPRPTADGDTSAESLRAHAKIWECLADLDDLSAARRIQLREVELARVRGLERPLPIVTGELTMTELWLGEWDAAAAHADEALLAADLGGSTPQGRSAAIAARAFVDAYRGDLEAAERGARVGLEVAGEGGDWVVTRLRTVLGAVALARSDAAAAVEALRAARDELSASGETEALGHRFAGDLVEAATMAGDLDLARSVVAALERSCETVSRPWVRVMAARGRALVLAAEGDLDGAHEAISVALREHPSLEMPFELARTELVAGRIARRRKERRRAADHLARAIDGLRTLGAARWLEIAEGELARTGRRAAGSTDALTETEDRVARLAAGGLTNREVAEQAFLAPKSVEGVLARVYAKLGIRSRAELGAWLAAQSSDRPEGPGD